MISCRVNSSSPCSCVHRSRFSPSVRPVTVILFPSISLFLSRYARISVTVTEEINDHVHPDRGDRSCHTGDAAKLVDVFHDVFTAGLEVRNERHAVGDSLEVVDSQVDTDGVGDGDKVEDGIC